MQTALTFVVQLGYKVLWFFDWLSNSPQKFISNVIKGIVVAAVLFFSIVPFYKSVSSIKTPIRRQFTDGLVYNIYGAPKNNSALFTSVLGAADVAQNVPTLANKIAFPQITSKSVLVIDLTTGKTLYKLNSTAKLAPASTTKLMTALVSLDLYKLDDLLEVPEVCTKIETEKAGFAPLAHVEVKDLLYALLVTSAGDAACTLATVKVPYTNFVDLMNKKAKNFNMNSTSFTNPVGLDAAESAHYSTAEDMATLAATAIKNDLIRKIVATREYDIPIQHPQATIHVMNTNKLLWDVPNSVGIKTGTTQEAGEVLIYQYKDDLKDLMIIVMGSQDRFFDTQAILKWILDSYSW